jgi:predicted DNA-binding transcriptional regulator YafY
MKLTSSLKTILLEAANLNDVQKAVKNKDVVVIYYDGDEPGGKGLRLIEPVCLGYSKANNLVLRAWDYEGASHKGYLGVLPLPSWRMFRLDKVQFIRPTAETFNEPRPNYNPNGDKSMTKVIINAVFDNTGENLA